MSKKTKGQQGLASTSAEWADFGFDDIFSGEQQPASSASVPKSNSTVGSGGGSQRSDSSGGASPPVSRESSKDSVGSGDGKKKEEKKKEEKKKCNVKGCKNRRFRRKYCAIHLNSEFDKEKDQDSKAPVKSYDDWSVSRAVQSGAYFKKNVITWRFVYKGEKHQVILKHSPVGGKRVVFVDGSRVMSEKMAGSSRHPLNIGNSEATKVPCAVVVKQGIGGLDYDLEIKGGSFIDAQHIWVNSTDI